MLRLAVWAPWFYARAQAERQLQLLTPAVDLSRSAERDSGRFLWCVCYYPQREGLRSLHSLAAVGTHHAVLIDSWSPKVRDEVANVRTLLG